MQYCDICNSVMRDGQCTNRRCATRNERLSSWIIDGVLWRFRTPLTREEAVEAVRDKSNLIVPARKPANSFVKPYTG